MRKDEAKKKEAERKREAEGKEEGIMERRETNKVGK